MTNKKTPIKGMYFPSDFATSNGLLLINFSIDVVKILENHGDLPIEILNIIREHYLANGRKYIKGFIIPNKSPDINGNVYSAYHNTYIQQEEK